MQRSLAASSTECAQLFNSLSALLRDTQSEARSSLEQAAIEDQSVRFRVWAGNLGAFHTLPALSSLDHRLRESPKVATQILALLQDLHGSLQKICAIACGERPNRRIDPDEDDDDGDDGDDGNDEFFEKEATGNQEPSTEDQEDVSIECPLRSEAEEVFESVKETIASLFRMSILIRKASPRDRFAKALSSRQANFDSGFDITHVGSKFPLLNTKNKEWFKTRLGTAITQRRQYLHYAREHRKKLDKDVKDLWQPEFTPNPKNTTTATDAVSISKSDQTSTTKPTSTLALTAASTLLLPLIEMREIDVSDNHSQTSYAISLGEDEENLHLRLPLLSDISKGASTFECPLCWTIQSIKNEISWRKHVFSDLRPYLCTFDECDLKLFSNRQDWFDHELKHHRACWHCHFCKRSDFQSTKLFKKHLRQHDQRLSDDQINALSEASKQPLECLPALDCPFCSDWELKLRQANLSIGKNDVVVVTPTQFRQHVGSHMQQLALFAIPRGYMEEDANNVLTESVTGVAQNNSLNAHSSRASRSSLSSSHDATVTRETAPETLKSQSIDVHEHARVIQQAMHSTVTLEAALIEIYDADSSQKSQDGSEADVPHINVEVLQRWINLSLKEIQFSSKFVADYVAAVADYLGELDNLYGYLEYIFDLWKMFPEGPAKVTHIQELVKSVQTRAYLSARNDVSLSTTFISMGIADWTPEIVQQWLAAHNLSSVELQELVRDMDLNGRELTILVHQINCLPENEEEWKFPHAFVGYFWDKLRQQFPEDDWDFTHVDDHLNQLRMLCKLAGYIEISLKRTEDSASNQIGSPEEGENFVEPKRQRRNAFSEKR